MLTIHLIIKNNEPTIENTIQSLLPLEAEIIAGCIGGDDRTAAICCEYGVKVRFKEWNQHYGRVRNALTTDGWNMYLEPWEVLASGHEDILEVIKNPPSKYSVRCWRGDVITKNVRIWHSKMSLKFTAPIFEGLSLRGSQELPVHIYSNGTHPKEAEEIVDRWIEEEPLSSDPHYYKSALLLSAGKYAEFLQTASGYIFRKPHGMKSIMTRHHMAMVYLYAMHDASKAVRRTLECLAVKPTMAEFWCLLGDIYHERQRFGKARMFYQNAIDLGSQRSYSDNWPIDYTKYKEYPETMMTICDKTKLVATSTEHQID